MFFKYRKNNRQQCERLQAQTKTRCRFMPPCPSGHPYAQGAEELTSTVLSIKCSIYFVALVIRYLIFLVTRRATNGKRSFPSEARSAEKKKRLFCYSVTILWRLRSLSLRLRQAKQDSRWFNRRVNKKVR